MLKQGVILICNASKTTEDRRSHEVIGVGAETIDNVVIVPNVNLRYLSIGPSKRLC